jgi:Glycosyl hydrolase family 79 C-terminal beta domain
MARSGTSRRLRRFALTALAVVLAVSGGGAVAAWAEPAATGTTIAVDRAHPFGALPRDFVGLSYEMRELSALCTTGDCTGNFNARLGNLVALYHNLGRSNIRIAGNQLDRDTLWVPAGQQPPNPLPAWTADVVTPNDIARLNAFLRATGWKAEVGINLAHYDPALAADEAHSLLGILGPRLVGAECGNEPNHYASNGYRPAPYGFPEHQKDWEACAALVGGNRLAAPDLSGPTGTATWFSQFAQAEAARIRMLTVHNYTGATTIAQLLSPQIHDKELADVAPQLAAAQAVHLPIRLDETNSAVGGGIAGVSDVYASALWAFDYNMVLAQAGFAGLNFHGGFGVCGAPLFNGKFQRYTPICAANAQDQAAKIYTVAPEYYGLYMATRMGTGRFLPVTVSSDRNVTAYAVRGNDGHLRIAVIEKDDTTGAPVPVSIAVTGASGTASVLHLTGSALATADGVAVQGATVDPNGRLRPGRADHVRVSHGTINLDVAAGSAVIITLDNCD